MKFLRARFDAKTGKLKQKETLQYTADDAENEFLEMERAWKDDRRSHTSTWPCGFCGFEFPAAYEMIRFWTWIQVLPPRAADPTPTFEWTKTVAST